MNANDLKIWLATVPDEAGIEFRGVMHNKWYSETDVMIRARVPERIVVFPHDGGEGGATP